MIQPTSGRFVEYVPIDETDGFYRGPGIVRAAVIAEVHDLRSVTLSVLGIDGLWSGHPAVVLQQPGDEPPTGRSYCRWPVHAISRETLAPVDAAAGPTPNAIESAAATTQAAAASGQETPAAASP